MASLDLSSGIPSAELIRSLYAEGQLRQRLESCSQDNTDIRGELVQAVKYKEDVEILRAIIQTLETQKTEVETGSKVLEDRIEELIHEAAEERQEHAKQLEQLKEEHMETLLLKDREMDKMKKELKDLRAFTLGKAKYDEMIRNLETQLAQEKQAHEDNIKHLNQEKLKATLRLRREVDRSLQETKASLISMNDKLMNSTTKMAMIENNNLRKEVKYLASENDKLMKKNKELEQRQGELKTGVNVQRDIEKQLHQRCLHTQRLLKEVMEQIASWKGVDPTAATPTYSKDAVRFLEDKVEELYDQISKLKEQKMLSPSSTPLDSLETRRIAASSIMTVLTRYIEKIPSKESDLDLTGISMKQFQDLNDADKLKLAKFVLAEAHRYIKDTQEELANSVTPGLTTERLSLPSLSPGSSTPRQLKVPAQMRLDYSKVRLDLRMKSMRRGCKDTTPIKAGKPMKTHRC